MLLFLIIAFISDVLQHLIVITFFDLCLDCMKVKLLIIHWKFQYLIIMCTIYTHTESTTLFIRFLQPVLITPKFLSHHSVSTEVQWIKCKMSIISCIICRKTRCRSNFSVALDQWTTSDCEHYTYISNVKYPTIEFKFC